MASWQRAFRIGLAMVLTVLGLGWGAAPTAADEVPDSPAREQAFDALDALAAARGVVPVIVGVRADFAPESALEGAQAVLDQRAAIARAQTEVERALAAAGAPALRRFQTIPYLALRADAAALAALRASPWVTSIEEDVPVPPALTESTALIGASTPATGAWAQGYTGAGWTVAVLDTGVDNDHPFLAGKVVAEACFSNGGGGGQSVCPGGAPSVVNVPDSAEPCAVDACDHGTHVAGIVAGKAYGGMTTATGGRTFSGVAPDAQLIAVQVFTQFNDFLDCGGSAPCALTYSSDQIEALEFVYSLRATYSIAAVNMSLGGSPQGTECNSDSRRAIIEQLLGAGIATVVASGNNSLPNAISRPACISAAVSVGSTLDGGVGGTPVDTVSDFSNSASFLDLLAPGELIQSSVPGTGFDNFQGTSMAAPHVAGAWAVLKQVAPSATVTETLTVLKSTGVSVTDSRNGLVKPRLELDAALTSLAPQLTAAASHEFGRVIVDLTSGYTLTLQNASSLSLTLSAPSLLGTGLAYTGGGSFPGTGGTCSTGSPLLGSAACTVRVTYAPTLPGTLAGSFNVSYAPVGVVTTTLLSQALTGTAAELCTDNLLNNAVFEKLATTWVQTDTVSGDALPLCTTGSCSIGAYAPTGPFSGGGWGWFGGYTTTVTTTTSVTQVMSQSVVVPADSASLQFYFNISRADAGTGITDTFRALIDSTPVFTATAAEQAAYSRYQLVRLDLDAFATGVTRTLTFSATTTAAGPVVNFNVDDAALCAPAFLPVYLPLTSRAP